MELQFSEEAPNLVAPVLAAINAGDYDAARKLLHAITDPQKQQAVQYTVASKTNILL